MRPHASAQQAPLGALTLHAARPHGQAAPAVARSSNPCMGAVSCTRVSETGTVVSSTAEAPPSPVPASTVVAHSQPAPPLAVAHLVSAPGGAQPPVGVAASDSTGWVFALAILFAARLGRLAAQEARMDSRKLQYDRTRRRALGRDLLLRRQEWELREAERMASEDAERVQQAALAAREALERRRQEQARYAAEAAREAERARAEREAARAAYEARQAALDAEYKERLAREAAALEEARARGAAEEERRRRREEGERARREEERRRQEEVERLRREEERRRRAEERAALERQKRRFALRLEGSVALSRPPRGARVAGTLEREAVVAAAVEAGTLLGGRPEPAEARYAAAADAAEELPALVAAQCAAAADGYASAVRLQAMTGDGPLAAMGECELRHWMALCAARSAVRAAAAAAAALQAFQQSGAARTTFEERTEYGVLPSDNPQSAPARFSGAVQLLRSGQWDQAAAAVGGMMDEEDAAFYAGLPPLPPGLERAPAKLGGALLLGFFVNWVREEAAAGDADEPVQLAEQLLQRALAGAPRDSLALPAALLEPALGRQHPLAAALQRLADANVSPARRAELEERERRVQAVLAARMLEEEWPDAEQARAARLADQQARTPLPERIWALRNVAGTLAMGGSGERGRARSLLEQAVALKRGAAGAADHPGVLPELVALWDVLRLDSEWAADASAAATEILGLLGGLAASYQASGDVLSAAVLLEAAVAGFGQSAGLRKQAVTLLVRRADDLSTVLSPPQRAALAEQRPRADQVLARVAAALTDELGAYQASTVSRAQLWDRQGVRLIGPLAEAKG